MIKSAFLLLPILVILTSCGPLDSELNAPRLSTRPSGSETSIDNQPVAINPDAIPTFDNTPTSAGTLAQKAITAPQSNRKFSFRTPDMIRELPTDSEVENNKPFQKTIDAKVEEGTTIRATE